MAFRRCPLYPKPAAPHFPHPSPFFCTALRSLAANSRSSVGPIHKLLKPLVRRLKVVVDDDDVVHAGGLGVLELELGLCEALLDAGLGLGAAAAEALLEGVLGGGRDENVAGVDAGGLDLLHALFLPSALLF